MQAGRVDSTFGHWLAGFSDGEGCFRIHKGKSGTYYACHFQIKLRDDDLDILAECQRRTRIGNIYRDTPSRQTRNSNPNATWVVQARAECWKLVSIFDQFPLRSKKARDYVIWKKALDIWTKMKRGSRWHGPRDWSPMIALKYELERTRAYSNV